MGYMGTQKNKNTFSMYDPKQTNLNQFNQSEKSNEKYMRFNFDTLP